MTDSPLYFKFFNRKESNKDKPLILFLHEGLGSTAQWKGFPDKLCEVTGLAGLSYDRAGFGQSVNSNESRTEDYLHESALNELPGLLEEQHVSQPLILFGHSDGGSMAFLFAAHFPDRVKAIVTEAAHIFVEEEALAGIKKTVELYETTDLKEKLSKYHGEKTDKLFQDWSGIWLSENFRSWSIASDLSEVSVPVCILQGIADEYASADHPLEIALKTAGEAQVHLLPDCGHAPHLQAETRVIEIVISFVEGLK